VGCIACTEQEKATKLKARDKQVKFPNKLFATRAFLYQETTLLIPKLYHCLLYKLLQSTVKFEKGRIPGFYPNESFLVQAGTYPGPLSRETPNNSKTGAPCFAQ
jgi:hypothetical protein